MIVVPVTTSMRRYNVPMAGKIFCIGFHKTGTTTLEVALQRLGYRVTGSFGTKDPDIASKVHELAYAKVPDYDAFEDNPWPILYRDLDARFPGSKFILTRRPSDAWIRSQVKDFASTETPMTLVPRFSHSSFSCPTTPNSVVQTGVKSFGWLNNLAQLSPIHSCKEKVP